MSRQHILNDAQFPLWFTTLENAVEESCHCLNHSAALSHTVCNTEAAAWSCFTGVKCICQCNRPLGYIYFPAKESAQLQIKRVVNVHNTLNLMLLGGAHEEERLAPGAYQSALMFPLFGHRGQLHSFCWKQF